MAKYDKLDTSNSPFTTRDPNPVQKRVYIAGPIAGYPDGNRVMFATRAAQLRERGWEVVSPHEVDHSHDGECRGRPTGREGDEHRYGCYLMADMQALLTCNAIDLLYGWQWSPGARAEVAFASACGISTLLPDLDFE